jgi:hypothetical protein
VRIVLGDEVDHLLLYKQKLCSVLEQLTDVICDDWCSAQP